MKKRMRFFRNTDGSTAKVFSSADKSTTDLHFNDKQYGVDGVFMQRFFDLTRDYRIIQVTDVICRMPSTRPSI